MTIPIEQSLIIFSLLLLLSIVASKASSRFGIPALLVFLGIGMLAGSEGPGGIAFDDPGLAQSLGVVALIFILFAGGLSTPWNAVKPVLGKGLLLSTLGVLLTALSVGIFATTFFNFTILEGILLGAIISSTDAAAVFAVLGSRSVSLKGALRPLLEFESGSNDPMAIFLTTSLISLMLTPERSVLALIPMFFQQMVIGGILGFGLGKLSIRIINSARLEYEGLYPVLSIALVCIIFGLTDFLGGNGFLAVYIAAIIIGNQTELIHRKSLIRFHDGVAWLMQIAMFLTLGLLVYPSRLWAVSGMGVVFALFLMLVARPLGVFSTLALSKMPAVEKLLLSWVGLRGAVPIILATFPLMAGLPKSDAFFNIVFFIVFTSVLLQGTTLPSFAKLLKLDAPLNKSPISPLEMSSSTLSKNDLMDIRVGSRSAAVGKRILELGLPAGVLIVFITRNDEHVVPTGGTTIEADDVLVLLANKTHLAELTAILTQEA